MPRSVTAGSCFVPRPAVETKKLRKKLANHKKIDATTKTTLKGREKKRATVADNQVIAIELALEEATDAHSRLVVASARSEADAVKA